MINNSLFNYKNTVSNINKRLSTDVVNNFTLHPFSTKTQQLGNFTLYYHKTKFLDNAQSLIGLQEVTADEYKKLSKEAKQNTQMRVIGNNGTIEEQWCAHTVSYIANMSNMNIGKHKKSVAEFITWAGNRYKEIPNHTVTLQNYKEIRTKNTQAIKRQLPNMKEGDLIIWKNHPYAVKLSDGSVDICSKGGSHIGIIEKIDIKNGIVTVIEGNANENVQGRQFERAKVKNHTQGTNGDQCIGEFQEVNRRDGLIRKQYKISDLANFGYSGYIDMQGIAK